jgi:hypothetical protein
MEKPVVSDPVDAAVDADVDEAALAAYGCDVAFTSDESTPADVLVSDAAERVDDPQFKQLLCPTYERLRATYEAGAMISHPSRLLAVVRESARSNSIQLNADLLTPLLPFVDRVNRVLFQHQTLTWLTGGDLKVRLYGAGWESHPTFSHLACGTIDTPQIHRIVWRASRIHLAASPFGAATEDVLAGISAGAFHLMRFCPADLIERFYPPIAEFCRSRGIRTTLELRSLAPRSMRRLVGFASRTLGMDVLSEWEDFVPQLLHVTSGARSRSAGAIWSSYAAICFHTRDELLACCTRYLYDGPERKRLADEMRRQLAESIARVTVSVDRELLTRLSASDEVAA